MTGSAGSALIFIVETLLSLLLFVFMLRVLLQWARADFRNPLAQAVVKITNPLVLPLRRVLPPVGKVDTASLVAVVLVAIVEVAIVAALNGSYGVLNPYAWMKLAFLEVVRTALSAYFYAILVYALLSMVAPGGYSPMQSLLASLCEPVLRPFRKIIPPIAGIDLSPLWALIAIQALLILLRW
jgi:YggT family protein